MSKGTVIVIVIFLAIVSAAICAYIAKRQNKDPWSWFLGGLLFNVFALGIILMAKNIREAKTKPQKGG